MLAKLVQEMEESASSGLYDNQYFQETIKRIESALRKLRKNSNSKKDSSMFAYKYSNTFNNYSWQ